MLYLTYTLFAVDLAFLFILLSGATWSIAFPDQRTWPPPYRRSWQWNLHWTCCFFIHRINLALIFLDWNSWLFPSKLLILAGIPLVLLGVSLAFWGGKALLDADDAEVEAELVSSGPYRFTRNPQYLGNFMICVGLGLIANSLLLWIAHALLSLVYILSTLAEERWLEDRCGQEYRKYRRDTPRFGFRWSNRRGTSSAKKSGEWA